MIFILLVTCQSGNKNAVPLNSDIIPLPPLPCEERSNPLDILNNKDTLKILIEFSDCGGWGGHKEFIYLQRNKDSKIFARFIMDTVSCDRIVERKGFSVVDDKTRKNSKRYLYNSYS